MSAKLYQTQGWFSNQPFPCCRICIDCRCQFLQRICLEERFSEPETFILRNRFRVSMHEKSQFKQSVLWRPINRHVRRTLAWTSFDILKAGTGPWFTCFLRHEIALFCFSLKSTTGPQKQHENDRNCPFPSHLLVWIQTIVWRISCLFLDCYAAVAISGWMRCTAHLALWLDTVTAQTRWRRS